VFAWIGLLGIPIGTIIAVVILLYLRKPGIQIIFSGVPAGDLTASQVAEVEEVSKKSNNGVVLAVVVGVLLIVSLPIVAAIAVPGLLRARMSGNEVSAMSTMRAISSAQVAYQTICGGYAPSLTVLGAGNYISAELATGVTVSRSGYRVTIQALSLGAAPAAGTPGCAETVTDYRALAEPENPGTTGVRYFAVGPDGVVYEDTVPMYDGRLSPTARPVSR
jgi:hypothetical protein